MNYLKNILEITLVNPVLFGWTKWFKFHKYVGPWYSYKKMEEI